MEATAADVSECLQSGAEPRVQIEGGYTPLHVAAGFNDSPDVVRVLLRAGAEPYAWDKNGKAPWDYVKNRERFKGSEAYQRLKHASTELSRVRDELDDAREEMTQALEAASGQAGHFVDVALLVAAGTILTLLQTTYIRPPRILFRLAYLLYVPGWLCLGTSIYYGFQAQAVHLGHLMFPTCTGIREGSTRQINSDSVTQLDCLEYGLVIFALWLFLYLCWWIFARSFSGSGDSSATSAEG